MTTKFEIEDDQENKIELSTEYLYVRIKNIDVKIKADDEGVVVDMYPAKSTDPESLASAYLLYGEAERYED